MVVIEVRHAHRWRRAKARRREVFWVPCQAVARHSGGVQPVLVCHSGVCFVLAGALGRRRWLVLYGGVLGW